MGTGLERGCAVQVQLASRGDVARSKAKSVSQPVICIVLKPHDFGAVLYSAYCAARVGLVGPSGLTVDEHALPATTQHVQHVQLAQHRIARIQLQ